MVARVSTVWWYIGCLNGFYGLYYVICAERNKQGIISGVKITNMQQGGVIMQITHKHIIKYHIME